MKWKPEMTVVAIRAVVSLAGIGLWYFMGHPVDQTTLNDVAQLLTGVLLGKELLKRTGD